MCGIAGYLQPSGFRSADAEANLQRMTAAIAYRGPDDSGTYVNAAKGIALGHRRLSIIDLSAEGHQPMRSASGRFVITFNGEIYNYRALRAELQAKGARFRGRSDTEVLLATVQEFGVEGALSRANGMFAFALWDDHENVLYLARDRAGEKPLYYSWQGGTFLFASELKALRGHAAFNAGLDRDALTLFMRYNYIPAPWSIYQGVHKLPAASLLRVDALARSVEPRQYWSARDVAEQGAAHPMRGTEDELVEELHELLLDAVRLRMESDVPLGAFLSGGIDSATVVSLMQQQSARPVRTFTIGFHEQFYNEAVHAAEIARHLNTDHTEWYITPAEAMAVIPQLSQIYDEPFADSSQIPTALVSALARRHVTVSLSGDGGDELFGGYNRYTWGKRIWRNVRWFPRSARNAIATGIRSVPAATWEQIFTRTNRLTSTRYRPQMPVTKLMKFADILCADSPASMYRVLVSHFTDPAALVIGAREPRTVLQDAADTSTLNDVISSMMYLDLITYLPDDILVKLDRASMCVSLEARVPLLDHRVIEFAWRLPMQSKVTQGVGKHILRRVLDFYIPRTLIDRPKMGFAVPVGDWLRGPLRPWAESLLDPGRLRAEGIFDPQPVLQLWQEHVTGRHDWQYRLWNVLMFQSWYEREQGVYSPPLAAVNA